MGFDAAVGFDVVVSAPSPGAYDRSLAPFCRLLHHHLLHHRGAAAHTRRLHSRHRRHRVIGVVDPRTGLRGLLSGVHPAHRRRLSRLPGRRQVGAG